MITARKKANIKFNIFLIWKKAGLVLFNFNLIFGEFPIIKKYIFESQFPLIEISILSAEFLSQIIISEIEFLSRPMISAGEVTIINGTIRMKFLIRNILIIQKIIDKFSIQISFLPTYRATVKTFVEYTAVEILVRETTMKKLKEAAANKKKRSKKTVGLTVIYPETWEIYLQEQ
jgi:hypothetical protein